jgi:hypothetical protein
VAKTYEENLYWKITVNDRLKKLVVQAGTDSSGKWLSIDNVEKLSSLIIRECCLAADDWYQNDGDIHWDPAQHIRKHFGVD